jgi:hypothetical protein
MPWQFATNEHLDYVAALLDDMFRIPGTKIRFGLDANTSRDWMFLAVLVLAVLAAAAIPIALLIWLLRTQITNSTAILAK